MEEMMNLVAIYLSFNCSYPPHLRTKKLARSTTQWKQNSCNLRSEGTETL